MTDDDVQAVLNSGLMSDGERELAAEVLRRGEVIATYESMIAKYRTGCEPDTASRTWQHLDRDRDQPMTDAEAALLEEQH